MAFELDHVIICADSDAPEAERLIQFGLREAPPNQHPGQGTANRRFFFANAMIELLWVRDPAEAQNERTRRTLLWERWSGRFGAASPFGICIRPSGSPSMDPPFPAWEYQPAYFPEPLALHIAETTLDEPMWVYIGFTRRLDWEQRFLEHPSGVREITALALSSPLPLRSRASEIVIGNGILSHREGSEHLLEIEFDHAERHQLVDFRPHLPIVFQL
jgi:hypothetical protein